MHNNLRNHLWNRPWDYSWSHFWSPLASSRRCRPERKSGLGKGLVPGLCATFLAATCLVAGTDLRAQTAPALRVAPHVRACTADQLFLSVNDENGAFAGMSQNGALLVLRNTSATACQMQALPRLRLENAHRSALDFRQIGPVRWGVGPAMMPVVVPPGAELTAKLRWVSSDAYGANHSIRAQYLIVEVGNKSLRTVFPATLFGAEHQPPELTLEPLHRDPTWGDCKQP